MEGAPAEFAIAREFGWTFDYIASLPNRMVLDLIAYLRACNEAKAG